MHKLVPQVGKGWSYWPLVLSVAKPRERLSMCILTRIDTGPRARCHNNVARIHSHSSDLSFPCLLTCHTSEHLADVVGRLSDLLSRHTSCHPRLVAVLWTIILKPSAEIPTLLKSRLLSTLTSRLEKIQDSSTPFTRTSLVEQDGGNTSVAELCETFTQIIFYRHSTRRQLLQQWCLSHALATFASDVPVETRWTNLILFALFNAPPKLSDGNNRILARNLTHSDNGPISEWRVVYTLGTLEMTIGTMGSLGASPTKVSEGIEDITRSLWRAWSRVTPDADKPPTFVTRAIVASFFRLAAVLRDISLRDACYRYSVANKLWSVEGSDELLTVEYVAACVACGEEDWHRIFSTLEEIFSGSTWQSDTATTLVAHFVRRDPAIAYQLSLFCEQNSIHVSDSLIHSLGMALVRRKRVDLAIRFLQHRHFLQPQMINLLGAILLPLAQRQSHCIDPSLISPVCDAMHTLYASSNASDAFRWRIERTLLLAVASGHFSKAIAIVQAIQHNSGSYFTPKFFFRLLRELVACRQFRYAMRLWDVVDKAQPSHAQAFRRALTFGLTKGGANRLARRVNRHQSGRSTKESLARALDFHSRCSSRVLALRILPTLQHTPSDFPSIQFALHLLTRANRILAARKLFESTQGNLDTKARTSLGNIVLHGALLRPSRRNGRRTRKVLSVLDLLVKRYSFVPDRITVNILLKSLLRWTSGVDSEKLKALFDHMIRSGYPSGRLPGAPFNTPLSTPGNFQLSNLQPFISFEKHVRPMYKMFIKAFHLRGDVRSAQVVIGILKEEERAALERWEIRSRARQEGRVRARRKHEARHFSLLNGA